MFFDEKFITELKQKNNVIDIVGKYCALKKKGSNYWACCPLPGHSEKTPSFTVNENGQFYKCFGCGRGGDVITFIMTMENMDYVEAVKYLAEQARMPLPEDDGNYEKNAENASKKERLLSLLKDAALFYVKNLDDEKASLHREYINKRQIDRKTMRAFGLGASLDMFALPKYLKTKGYTEQEMLDSGVCQQKTNAEGKTYNFDAQYGRLIIPIINNFGNVIAFGGRVLEAKPDFAKYKNTQETSVFIKNRTLYNINNLKKEKSEHGLKDIIMVEGYMDTISVYKGGFHNVVASMGTSLTKEQARLLKRYADTVLICYDGDSAGQKATVRGLDILKDEGLEVKVVSLPEGLDPDDIIKKYGAEAYGKCLAAAMPLIDFKLHAVQKKYNIDDVSEKRKFVRESLAVIKECGSVSEQEELLKKLRDITGLTYESLKRDLENLGEEEKESEKKEIVAKPVSDKIMVAERFILCALAFNKPYSKKFDFANIRFNDETHVKIADYISALIEDNKDIKPMVLYDVIDKDKLDELNEVLTAGDGIFGSGSEEKYFGDCALTIIKGNLEKDLDELNALYTKETDIEKRKDISALILKISNKLMRY